MRALPALTVLLSIAITGCGRDAAPPEVSTTAAPEAVAPGDEPPTLFDTLGDYHRPVTTQVPEAQRWFDQGLRLTYAFNHQAAGRAYAEAARLDPDCAMCWWGQALVLGPNINLPMPPEAASPAHAALEKALALAPRASANERALIEALATRYALPAPEDRSALDQAYADAMAGVVERFPDDLDAATLYAEALMDLSPWAYWTREGAPASERTGMILSTLESVLARDPRHPGAIHYYIHATEASPDPHRAVAYAETLATLMPGAGHLVHMPAHTYLRVGRYHDASLANLSAIDADTTFLSFCRGTDGVYPLGYVPHNWHFLSLSAGMEGASAMALRAAEQTAARVDRAAMDELSFMQQFVVAPLVVQVRFGRWEEILAQAGPPDPRPFPTAMWHFARGMALLRTGEREAAEAELAQLQAIAADPAMAEVPLWGINPASAVLPIGRDLLAGEIALAAGDNARALESLRAAAAGEDALTYNEPSDWALPVRPYLGAALLATGDHEGAARVFAEDLHDFPDNGWSLKGLQLAQAAAGQDTESASAAQRFETAWQHADIALEQPRF